MNRDLSNLTKSPPVANQHYTMEELRARISHQRASFILSPAPSSTPTAIRLYNQNKAVAGKS